MGKGHADFDLETARFVPSELGEWPLDDLPAPGEDLTGSVMLEVPADLAAKLQEAADRRGLTVAAELDDLLRRSA